MSRSIIDFNCQNMSNVKTQGTESSFLGRIWEETTEQFSIYWTYLKTKNNPRFSLSVLLLLPSSLSTFIGLW
jgi:hypothetical protein